ncbi:histidine kinase [Rhizobium sp. Root274]|uniref:sensor histidine kinase n=1 Tax=unclassified Rhizobium TaxID=2613769 RepID=UPI000714D4B6|nr:MULTISPECIES: HAMP domain-containing sensor histidine kinase [unclassified Rhizobium]KQW29138.1 histidine kinase [Rhizobium sp. Root1240]KRD29333.1 histidine kinase [Rhizobium sp. Root274]
MNRSIRIRFVLVSLLSVAAALSLAAFAFVELFTRSIEHRLDQELTDHLNNIAGQIEFAPDGTVRLPDRTTDIRFSTPYGGLYWQMTDDQRGTQLRSPSLWDYTLPLPDDQQETGTVHRYDLQGPDAASLLVQERKIIAKAPDGERPLRIAVAIDRAAVSEARQAFVADIIPYLLALAAFLVAASVAQLTFGLRPLSAIGDGLERIRARQATRLTGPLPIELKPMVDAMNGLLDDQDALIARARARAADLAHGLKTPLTVLANDAGTLRERGEVEIGEELAHLASVMRNHVDRELARARIAATASLRSADADLGQCVAMIVRTLKRTPDGERLAWTIAVPEGLKLGVDPSDLEELIGNMVENAVKWAKGRIDIQTSTSPAGVTLVVADDGPGVGAADLKRMTERGVRLDSRMPGTGIGLSIAGDIAEVYGIGIEITNGESAGLRVSLHFQPQHRSPIA